MSFDYFYSQSCYKLLWGDFIPKVMKIFDKLAIVLPDDLCKKLGLSEGSSIKIYEIKPGIIGISAEIFGREIERGIEFSEDERRLLKKLLSFKFEDRIPEKVNKQLSNEERRTLSGLIRKRAVTIYKQGKYEEKGVYNITNRTYLAITGKEKRKKTEKKEERKEERVVEEKDPLKRLGKNGYLVLDSEFEAKKLSEKLSLMIRKREIIGIRGFDKKFYIIKREFLTKHQPEIEKTLESGRKSIDQISKTLSIDKQACIALLTILNESGEIVEKRKGMFALAE